MDGCLSSQHEERIYSSGRPVSRSTRGLKQRQETERGTGNALVFVCSIGTVQKVKRSHSEASCLILASNQDILVITINYEGGLP